MLLFYLLLRFNPEPMHYKYITLFFLLNLLSLSSTTAQNVTVNNRCRQAYTKIIELRFDDAKTLIDKEKRENPDNIYTIYLENWIDFLTLFIDENESVFEQIKDREDNRIEQIDLLPDSNPYKNYLKANIKLQWAIAGLKFQNYLSAAIDIRSSYVLINKNKEQFPGFNPQLITLGVLHIIIGMVPDQYQWILSLISMEGTVPQGEDELTRALNNTQSNTQLAYLEPEVLFYLGFTEMNLGLNTKRKEQLLYQLSPYTPNNLMLTFLKANILARMGRNEEALQLLNTATRWKGYHPFYYLYYLKGEYRLRKLDADAATDYLYYTNHFKGINFVKDAWRKAAWSYLIKGDTATYLLLMKKVLITGETEVDVDKEAYEEALSGKIPSTIFIKARLLFDGGYYNKARQQLLVADTSSLSIEEKLEWYYRLGRIEQKSGNRSKAKKYFRQAIEQGRESKRYFAGNAALQLGNIFESEGDFSSAIKYYRLCRNLDFNEYEMSIKTKAKQGIKRIEERNNNSQNQ